MPDADVQFEVQLTETGRGGGRGGGGQGGGGGTPPGTPSPPSGPPEQPDGGEGASFQQWLQNLFQSQGGQALPSIAASGVTAATGSPTLGSMAGIGVGSLASSSMAGPIGLAAAGAMIASEVNDMVLETVERGMLGAANLATSPQRADPAKMALEGMSEATTFMDPLEKLTGINLMPMDNIFRALIETTKTLIDNFDSLGETMAEFSGPVAAAQAQREVAQLQTEMYRAQQMGPEMAEYIQARTQTTEEFERLKIDIQKTILPILTDLVSTVQTGVEFTRGALESWADIPASLRAALMAMGPANPFAQTVLQLLDAIAENTKESMEAGRWQAHEEYQRKLQNFFDPASMFGGDHMSGGGRSDYVPPAAPPRPSEGRKIPFGAPIDGGP